MRFLPTLLLLFAPAVLAQGTTLEVIQLRNRTVEQVLPVLRPVLDPGGALSGQFGQLIVRTSPGNLAQIRAALDAIDRPARRLVISVRFDNTQQSARAGVQTDARVSNRGARTGMAMEDSPSAREGRADERLQVLEGGQAFISTGESRNFSEAATGFAIVPRTSGVNVFLDIAAQRENFSRGGAVQGQRALSTVSGRLGEWIELGGAGVSETRTQSGLLSSGERTAVGERRIWVKVDEAGN